MSHIKKRSTIINGRKTSISLEEEFWAVIVKMARDQGVTIAAVVSRIADARPAGNLSSALRVAVLAHEQKSP